MVGWLRRWRWEIAVVTLVAALLGLCYLSLAWYGFDLLEEGYFLTNARRVQLGGLPYRDFDTPYAPGVFYLYAAVLTWTGQSLVALRGLQIIGRVVYGVALYAAGRRLMPPFYAALPPLLILAMDTAPELWGIHPGWFTAPAALLAVLAVAAYLRTGRSRWLLLSGIASGIGFALKQNLPAYGVIAALWFLVVEERHLPPARLGPLRRSRVPLPIDKEIEPARQRFGAGAIDRWAQPVRLTVQAAALVLLPLTALVLVRPYLTGLVFTLFVLPAAVVSGLAAAAVRRGDALAKTEGGAQERLCSFFVRPALLLAGFFAVTLPWLVATVVALRGDVRLLGPLVGQVDPTGYFFGMQPMGPQHAALIGTLLAVPVAVAALGTSGLWGPRGVAVGLGCALAGLLPPVLAAARVGEAAGAVAGEGEPWSVVRGAHGTLAALGAAWARYRAAPHATDDLVLYLPVLAFWAAGGLMAWDRVRRRGGMGNAPRASGHRAHDARQALRRWYLVAGVALFLNQYPRMDEIHLLWSAGLLLVVGADALHRWQRWLSALGGVRRVSAGRQWALGASLALLPLAAALPHLVLRSGTWAALARALPGTVEAAPAAGDAPLVPLAMPGGTSRVWAPAPDAEPIAGVVDMLREKTAPGEPIFTYPAIPGFYYLADRPNPTRFNHLFAGIAPPAAQQEMVRQLEAVRYVVWDDGGAHYWVKPGDNPPVTEYVRTHFRVERFIGPYAVLSRDAEGPQLPYFLPGAPRP